MKIKHMLFLGLTAALGSCSTAYRTGQTPDDVYYSPAPPQNTYVTKENRQEENTYVTKESDEDQNSYSYRNEDEDIRRGIENPVYRNSITFSMGMGYGYNPYSLFPYNAFNNPFYGYDPFGYSPYAYNSYGYSPYGLKGMYNPYFNPYAFNDFGYYSSPFMYSYSPYSFGYSPFYSSYSPLYYPHGFSRINTNTGARKYNLNAYNNTAKTVNPVTRGTAQPVRTVETTAPGRTTGVGNVIRRVFTPSQRNSYTTPNSTRTYDNNNTRVRRSNTNSYENNQSNTNETRSFSPRSSSSNTPSSSSGSSNSNSAPVRTFRR